MKGILARDTRKIQNFSKTQGLSLKRHPRHAKAEEIPLISEEDEYEPCTNDSISQEIMTVLNKNHQVDKYNHRFGDTMMKFSFILYYWYNPYGILRTFLPFPSHTSVLAHFGSSINKTLNGLINLKYTQSLVSRTLHPYLNPSKDPIKAILSIDSLDINQFKKDHKRYKSIFLMYLLLPNEGIKSFPVHVLLHKSGKATEDVKERIFKVVQQINFGNQANITILAVDGDPGYNSLHRTQFAELHSVYKTRNFAGLIAWLQNAIRAKQKLFFITDMIHFSKNRRTQLVMKGALIKGSRINIEALSMILNDSPCISDVSPLSKMQDTFPIQIFNFFVIKQLLDKEAWDLILFLFPMACWIEACLNTKLDRPSRLYLLQAAFMCFMNIYEHQQEIVSKSEFISQISLIRALNTLAIVYAEFAISGESFCFDRYSTMPQEHFHGCIRGLTRNNDYYDSILKNIAKSVLVHRYKTDLGLTSPARSRLSVGGVHWFQSMHTLSCIPRDCANDILPDIFVDFLMNMAGYRVRRAIPPDLLTLVAEYVRDVAEGTFHHLPLKKVPHGRSILSRQISNSTNSQEMNEDDFDNSPDERTSFRQELVDFCTACDDVDQEDEHQTCDLEAEEEDSVDSEKKSFASKMYDSIMGSTRTLKTLELNMKKWGSRKLQEETKKQQEIEKLVESSRSKIHYEKGQLKLIIDNSLIVDRTESLQLLESYSKQNKPDSSLYFSTKYYDPLSAGANACAFLPEDQ